MPIVSVLAASHAPNMLLEPGEQWADFMRLHHSMAPTAAAYAPSIEERRQLAEEIRRNFGLLRAAFERSGAEVVIVVANDQFVNFFLDNIPIFCLSVAEETEGQFVQHHLRYPGAPPFARAVLHALVQQGFDVAFSERIILEHTHLVPLYYLVGERRPAVVPLFVNTWVEPLPAPGRCYQLGQALAEVLSERPERVAILATGGLSHYPGSPRIGEIDTSFDARTLGWLQEGRNGELAGLSLDELRTAGNTELLNWIVAAGCAGQSRATTAYVPDLVATGLGFATWNL